MMAQINLNLSQSPMKNALDIYYSWILDLIRPDDQQRVALNNIITSIDMFDNTNFYNQYIFRSFADRPVYMSPTDNTLGNMNSTTSYSYYWLTLLEQVIVEIDFNLLPENQLKIDELDRQIGEFRTKLVTVRKDFARLWKEIVEEEGLDPKAKFYFERKRQFADDYGLRSTLAGLSQDIQLRLVKQNTVRLGATPSPADRALIVTYQYSALEQHRRTLPRIPDFERNDNLSASDLADLAITGVGGEFETEADIRPVGDLRNFFKPAAGPFLNVTFSQTKIAEHKHDMEWKTSASGGWSWFKASVSAEQESHLKSSLEKVTEVTIGATNIADYPVQRGRWFNPGILNDKRVQKVLADNPILKGKLANAVSSLILARGLLIQLKFSDKESLEEWHKTTFSGSGGVNLLGVRFGGSGSYYEYDWRLDKDELTFAVTIKDDPLYGRLIGFKTEEVISVSLLDIQEEIGDPSNHPLELIERLSANRLSQVARASEATEAKDA